MALHCPDCRQSLQSVQYEGVGVAHCAPCSGYFLGRDDLQRIAQTRATPIPRNSPPPPRRPSETPRNCPRCSAPMRKGKVGKLRVTTFDLCEPCASLWLDRGELDAIQLDHEMVSDNLAKARRQATGAVTAPGVAATATAAAPAASGFRCPKCSHPQVRGTECLRCGIVFAKFEAAARERAAATAGDAALVERMDSVFARLTGFEIQQQYHLTEALVGFERANRYALQPVPASATGGRWQAEEANRSAMSILGRNLLGSLYTFTINVLDEDRRRVLMCERKARFYFHHLDVFDETGRAIGSAQRRFSWFDRLVSVRDDRGRELLRITGPYFRPWTFLFRQSGRDAGEMKKKWSGTLKELYTDADRFTLQFDPGLDARGRRLALGTVLLLDSLYFEGRKPFLRHFFDAPGVQIILVVALIAGLLFLPGSGS